MQRVFTTKYQPPVEVKANLNGMLARYDINTTGSIYAAMDTVQLMDFYKTVAPFKSAMDMLSRAVSSIPIKLVNTKDDTAVKVHPFLDVLKKPNIAYQKTMTQFFASMAFWKVLSGDVYIILTGRTSILEAYVVRSVDVEVHLDATGFIDYYDYRTMNSGLLERYSRDNNGRYFSVDGMRELVHLSSLILEPDTTDQGAISDVAALREEFEQYTQVTRHNTSLLRNGGRPSGALVIPQEAGQLDPKARAELQKQINSTFAGAANAGRPMLLEGGMEWKNFATSPKDGDFNTAKADAEAQIFKAVGVPLDLAGNSKAVSANNMVNIRREFYKSRVVPLMQEMLEFMNNFMLTRYGRSTVELQVDFEKIDVFVEERTAMMQLIENSTSRTPNEKRKAQGLTADLEGGDNLYDPNGRFIAGPDAAKFMNNTRAVNTPTVATP